LYLHVHSRCCATTYPNHPLHLSACLLVTFEIRVSPVLIYLFSFLGMFLMSTRIGASPRSTLSLSLPPGGTNREGFCRRTAISLYCVGVRCDVSADVTFSYISHPSSPNPLWYYHCDAEAASRCSLNIHPVISFAVPPSDLHLSNWPVSTDPESLLLADYGCFGACILLPLLHHYVRSLPCELMRQKV
jgi:hypothetical protein